MHTIIYIDMDGTTAKWDPNGKWQDKDYYLHRDAQSNMLEYARLAKTKGQDVRFLTAYPSKNAKICKIKWNNAHGVGHIPCVFVPYGDNKANYIEKGTHVLIDDFTDNLIKWELSGNVGIKFRNQINGTKGRWDMMCGPSIWDDMSAEQIEDVVNTVIKDLC